MTHKRTYPFPLEINTLIRISSSRILIMPKTKEQRNQDLLKACREGNIPRALDKIQKGADVNCRDNEGLTPLHWASRKGHRELASALILSYGASLEAKDDVSLQI